MKKTLILFASVFALGGCTLLANNSDQSTSSSQETNAETTNTNASLEEQVTSTVEAEGKLDAPVEIADDVAFLQMTDQEKAAAYAPLDQIEKYSAGKKSPISYSNIVEIKDQQAYRDFSLSTQKEAKIVYLGFDECPYCKAFTPKLSQFVKEMDVTVYYYNTRKRANDQDFESVIATFNVDTVPHAFIVKNGKPIQFINHTSTMADIEAFVAKVVEMNK